MFTQIPSRTVVFVSRGCEELIDSDSLKLYCTVIHFYDKSIFEH